MGRQHHAVIIYDTDQERFYIENWENATGRDEGDVWDDEAEDWRYPDNEVVPNEEELDEEMWKVLRTWLAKLPTALLKSEQEKNEEPDLLY
jgi:hypothetical protein